MADSKPDLWDKVLTNKERDDILEMFLGIEKVDGQYYASTKDYYAKKPTIVDLPQRITLLRAIEYCCLKNYLHGFKEATDEVKTVVAEHLGININFTIKTTQHVFRRKNPSNSADG